ncbi:MAG: M36 family metallopeptidase [Actinomycetota bacterium]
MPARVALLVAVFAMAALQVTEVAATHQELSPEAQIAIAHLGVDPETVRVTDEYTSDHNGVSHVYLRQIADGVDIAGADATVNVQDGIVIHSGSRFVDPSEISGSQQFGADIALEIARSTAPSESAEVVTSPELLYRVLDDGTVRLVYDVQIQTPTHWWNLSIDAENGRVVHRYDFVDSESQAGIAARTARPEDAQLAQEMVSAIGPPEQAIDGSSYVVFAMPLESPNDGNRVTVHNPADAAASPFGWHDTNGAKGPESTLTTGNNVNAYADSDNNNQPDPGSQPDGGSGLDFNHLLLTYDATPAVYRDAAVDNLFYWNNVMHDVTHKYGFNEEAGNFQVTNYTGTGKGADAVQAEAQDGGGVLNANFATPVDGGSGRMQMYLWVDAFDTLGLGPEDIVRPYSHQVRDGDLDGGVIAHEYGHGVSNRLVGGPSNVSCLRTHDEREGEGWSDWWSYVLTMRPGDDGATPRGIGTYVVYHEGGRRDVGIRITPYSTDMTINPSTYNTIKTAAEPHGVGYVWASMLWDLYWNLAEEHGFNPNPYEPWYTGGNNLAIQLSIDGMKFAPCEPGFADARDAIIAADAALTGDVANGVPGENECLIWRTFARRGLGVDASQGNFESKTDGKNGFAVPDHCATG